MSLIKSSLSIGSLVIPQWGSCAFGGAGEFGGSVHTCMAYSQQAHTHLHGTLTACAHTCMAHSWWVHTHLHGTLTVGVHTPARIHTYNSHTSLPENKNLESHHQEQIS